MYRILIIMVIQQSVMLEISIQNQYHWIPKSNLRNVEQFPNLPEGIVTSTLIPLNFSPQPNAADVRNFEITFKSFRNVFDETVYRSLKVVNKNERRFEIRDSRAMKDNQRKVEAATKRALRQVESSLRRRNLSDLVKACLENEKIKIHDIKQKTLESMALYAEEKRQESELDAQKISNLVLDTVQDFNTLVAELGNCVQSYTGSIELRECLRNSLEDARVFTREFSNEISSIATKIEKISQEIRACNREEIKDLTKSFKKIPKNIQECRRAKFTDQHQNKPSISTSKPSEPIAIAEEPIIVDITEDSDIDEGAAIILGSTEAAGNNSSETIHEFQTLKPDTELSELQEKGENQSSVSNDESTTSMGNVENDVSENEEVQDGSEVTDLDIVVPNEAETNNQEDTEEDIRDTEIVQDGQETENTNNEESKSQEEENVAEASG